MSPIKITTSQDMDYEPIPEGLYKTRITKIQEKEQFNRFNNAQELGFNIEFTILEGEEKDRKAFRFFTPFLTANSKLTALCKAVMNREFTVEEMVSVEGVNELQNFIGGHDINILVKTRVSKTSKKEYYTVSDFLNSGPYVGIGKGVDSEVEMMSEEAQKAVENQPSQSANSTEQPKAQTATEEATSGEAKTATEASTPTPAAVKTAEAIASAPEPTPPPAPDEAKPSVPPAPVAPEQPVGKVPESPAAPEAVPDAENKKPASEEVEDVSDDIPF